MTPHQLLIIGDTHCCMCHAKEVFYTYFIFLGKDLKKIAFDIIK